jgi:hypothetical protein
MSNIKDFIGGSGGGFDPRNFTRVDITTSQNWVAPAAKGDKFFVVMQGAGGSGAQIWNGGDIIFGGGAGQIVTDIISLTTSQSITISIGVGGNTARVNGKGNAGGNTSIGTLTAKGGAAGLYYTPVAGVVSSQLAVSYATTGDLNISPFGIVNFIGKRGKSDVFVSSSLLGGEAGLGGNGNDVWVYPGVKAPNGAGGGAASNTSYSGGDGGDGIVIIFYEAV